MNTRYSYSPVSLPKTEPRSGAEWYGDKWNWAVEPGGVESSGAEPWSGALWKELERR